MKHFTSVHDVEEPMELVQQALEISRTGACSSIGTNKVLGLIFFNPSLRTRMSTQKAAYNLGMKVMVMNINKDSWNIEFQDGSVMDGDTQEHIKDAVQIISGYCDLVGVRSFATLSNRREDYEERVLSKFKHYSSVPVISLESATLHPLQSLADLVTIGGRKLQRPKVVLSWTPHPKALPQAVANSFLQWITHTDAEVVVAHPKGYALSKEFTGELEVTDDQQEAFTGADIIYAKNWSSFNQYGQTPPVEANWTITADKMNLTNEAQFMHCLPIRRNVVATDEVIDQSLVYRQAKNREHAAQAVLQKLLEDL